jgi:hypothetical protein
MEFFKQEPWLKSGPLPPLRHQPNFRQRILVVDDDPLIRRLNSEVLIYSGYQVNAADDGAAARRPAEPSGHSSPPGCSRFAITLSLVNNSAWTDAAGTLPSRSPMLPRNNRILHVDGDLFFAICEIALDSSNEN